LGRVASGVTQGFCAVPRARATLRGNRRCPGTTGRHHQDLAAPGPTGNPGAPASARHGARGGGRERGPDSARPDVGARREMMNCDECHDLLQRRLDVSPPTEPSALERHLAGCPACRADHAAAQLLEDHLKRHHKPVPPADLADRIVAGLLAEQRARLRARRRWLVGIALAASLLLACLAGYRWLRQPGAGVADPSPLTHREPRTLPRAPAQIPAVATTSLSQTVEDARTAVAALTDRTVTQARQLWTAAPALEVRPVA